MGSRCPFLYHALWSYGIIQGWEHDRLAWSNPNPSPNKDSRQSSTEINLIIDFDEKKVELIN